MGATSSIIEACNAECRFFYDANDVSGEPNFSTEPGSQIPFPASPTKKERGKEATIPAPNPLIPSPEECASEAQFFSAIRVLEQSSEGEKEGDEYDFDKLERLTEIGQWDRETCKAALEEAGGNVDRAAEILMSP